MDRAGFSEIIMNEAAAKALPQNKGGFVEFCWKGNGSPGSHMKYWIQKMLWRIQPSSQYRYNADRAHTHRITLNLKCTPPNYSVCYLPLHVVPPILLQYPLHPLFPCCSDGCGSAARGCYYCCAHPASDNCLET